MIEEITLEKTKSGYCLKTYHDTVETVDSIPTEYEGQLIIPSDPPFEVSISMEGIWEGKPFKHEGKGYHIGTIPYILPDMPVLYMPDRKEIVLGCQCWWGRITKE